MAKIAAIRYSSEHILDYVEISDDYGVFEVTVPKNWLNKTVGQLDIRRNYNINILGLKRNGRMDASVDASTVFDDERTLLVLGDYKTIQKIFKI
jgi:trk system potassium uptake protein TrkA